MLYIMQLAISATTLVVVWLIGSKNIWGQRLALVSNALWWAYVLASRQWGLIPLQIGLSIVTVRSLILWERDERRKIAFEQP